MTAKVKLAVFDQDLVVRKYGKFELSSDGSKIRVVRGGATHFMPSIANTTFLEFERRSIMPPFRTYRERVYFARNMSKHCVDFATENVDGPDLDVIKQAINRDVANKWGTEKKEPPILLYVILGLLFVIVIKLFEVI